MRGRYVYLIDDERALIAHALRAYHFGLIWSCEQQMKDGLIDEAEADRQVALRCNVLADMLEDSLQHEHAATPATKENLYVFAVSENRPS